MAETSVLEQPQSSQATATHSAPSQETLADAYEIEPQAAVADSTDAGNVNPPSQPAPAPGEGGTSLERRPDGTFLPKTHRHPQALVEDASDFGMSADEIAGLDTNTLSMTLRYMRKNSDRERSKAATMDGAMDRNLGQEESGAPGGAQPAAAPPADDLAIEERDAFDPRFLAVVDKLTKKVKELEGRLSDVTGHLAAQANRSYTDRCDSSFKRHKEWLGDKSFEEMKADDPMLVRRKAVISLVKTMKGGALESNIDRAVQMLYGTETPAASPTPPANGISKEEWDNAGVAVPTSRRTDDLPPGPAKAARSVKKLIDAHRQATQQDQSTTLADELL